MRIGLRIFILRDDNSLERIPKTIYERLHKSDPNTFLKKFADKKIRCIEVLMYLKGRKPLAIRRITYPILNFDSEGRLDTAKLQGCCHTVMEMLPGMQESEDIVKAGHLFAENKYEHKYSWSPIPEIEKQIMRAILSEENSGRH